MPDSGSLASRKPTSIDKIYEAIDKLAPEFETEARKSEIELDSVEFPVVWMEP